MFIDVVKRIQSGESIVTLDQISGKVVEKIDTLDDLKCKLDRLIDLEQA
jgi:hypothetical protein